MFDEHARAFLQQPLVARLAVNDPEGYPHVVPVWFMLDGDEIVMISAGQTAKIRYLEADGRAAVTIGGDTGQAAGYLIKGEITVSSDTDLTWTRKLTFHYEPPEQAEKDVVAWADLDMRVLRLRPVRVFKVA
ncbi:MAG: pyridoxamine 5'-phosphate oxidase family protein [Anaerolineae bacterium]|nr:pyridoxamine 5'-phosphate oxidase family protein [Anaerolineae bacterium]